MSNRTKWAIALAVLAALVGIVWFGVGYYLDSWHVMVRSITRAFFVRQLFPGGFNLLHATPFFFILVMIGFGVLAYLRLTSYETRGTSYNKYSVRVLPKGMGTRVIGGALVLAGVLSFLTAFGGLWDNDKDEANSYLGTTQFVVEDMDTLPSSIVPLVDGATRNAKDDSCAYTSKHDVTSCVVQGNLPTSWDSRVASATGADIVMSRTSDSVPNTTIMKETLTYLYNEDGTGVWSVIRNGKNRQPLYGIAAWNGADSPESCRFTGNNALNYAFGGKWGQNLDDTLAKDFPGLLYDHNDMWGYCLGDGDVSKRQPVIVIPVSQEEPYNMRTTRRPAGVLVITGSPSGEPNIQHKASVKAGELPGPVYPLTLVSKQREMVMWAAGRANKNRLNFGFEATDVASQAGNNSEYLLRSKNDGRLYWVTPLKPRSTDSQQLVAYSITPADEVMDGELGTQKIYVLPDNDPRIVNVDDMEARVSQAIRDSNPGFFTGDNPGRIAEFLPVTDTKWQAFAELGGRVLYRIEVSSDAKIKPTVQSLDSSAPTGEPKPANQCTKQPTELSEAELAACITSFANELKERATK